VIAFESLSEWELPKKFKYICEGNGEKSSVKDLYFTVGTVPTVEII